MNKSFVKELILTNYLMIGSFCLIVIAGNLVYGGTAETWVKSLSLLVLLALALALKIWRIRAGSKKLDERLQIITYRAVTIGFYFMLGAIFWFYTREMIVEGEVSARTVIEMVAGLAGYLGGFFVLSKKY